METGGINFILFKVNDQYSGIPALAYNSNFTSLSVEREESDTSITSKVSAARDVPAGIKISLGFNTCNIGFRGGRGADNDGL